MILIQMHRISISIMFNFLVKYMTNTILFTQNFRSTNERIWKQLVLSSFKAKSITWPGFIRFIKLLIEWLQMTGFSVCRGFYFISLLSLSEEMLTLQIISCYCKSYSCIIWHLIRSIINHNDKANRFSSWFWIPFMLN